ncbi:MAG: ATP-binding protein [Duncaniella sp.]|nr:ATP-binding protein [Duncaniella sp.]HBI57715.1 hypothetical protein [Porphyromonadaceae bacterium]
MNHAHKPTYSKSLFDIWLAIVTILYIVVFALTPMSLDEALETTKIHSVAGKLKSGSSLMTHHPLRSPHHTISPVALVGGGSNPVSGEISLAHNGVLFLDEFPEFSRPVLEVMRQPLEDRHITIARAYDRILKVARTIADINASAAILPHHLNKAISCRNVGRRIQPAQPAQLTEIYSQP